MHLWLDVERSCHSNCVGGQNVPLESGRAENSIMGAINKTEISADPTWCHRGSLFGSSRVSICVNTIK